ncbi:hypothetical protein V1511DRAFT_500671 [Dipodascopsis uninucleata]
MKMRCLLVVLYNICTGAFISKIYSLIFTLIPGNSSQASRRKHLCYSGSSSAYYRMFSFLRTYCTILIVTSLLEVNLQYPLYSPKKYRPFIPAVKIPPFKRPHEFIKNMDNLLNDTFQVNMTMPSSNITTNSSGIYNGTMLSNTTYLNTTYLVGQNETISINSVNELGETSSTLSRVLAPIAIFIGVGLLVIVFYLYGCMKRYISEIVAKAVEASVIQQEQQRRQGNRGFRMNTSDSGSDLSYPEKAAYKDSRYSVENLSVSGEEEDRLSTGHSSSTITYIEQQPNNKDTYTKENYNWRV